jgi:hypothetical protein
VIALAALLFYLLREPGKTVGEPSGKFKSMAKSSPAPAATPATVPAPSIPLVPPRRLQFGVPVTRAWMQGGWSVDEKGGSETYVWSDGPVSQLQLMLPVDDDVTLDFAVQPYVYPGHPTQTVTVVLNGTTVGKVSLRTGLHSYRILLPKPVIRSAPNTLEFVYGYAERPQIVEKSSPDTRQLGVAWHSIDLTPGKK